MPPKPVPTHRLIHTRRYRALRERVLHEEPVCRLRLPGCTLVSDSVDHVIPRSMRPDLVMVRSNLRGVCASCNSRRGNRMVIESKAPPRPEPAQVSAFFGLNRQAPRGDS
jgi:5-methylcytosine-specific restriction endonuclease McrA